VVTNLAFACVFCFHAALVFGAPHLQLDLRRVGDDERSQGRGSDVLESLRFPAPDKPVR
jgi:hypothetical protein